MHVRKLPRKLIASTLRTSIYFHKREATLRHKIKIKTPEQMFPSTYARTAVKLMNMSGLPGCTPLAA